MTRVIPAAVEGPTIWQMRPLIRFGVLALVLTPLLSGCGALQIGFTAVGVDKNGAPVAHVVVCEGEIDGLVMRQEDTDEVGRFKTGTPITANAQIPLLAPGVAWTVLRPLVEVTKGVQYQLGGYDTQDANVTGGDVVFDTTDLAALGPRQVLSQEYVEDEKGNVVPVDVVQDADRFRAHSCDDYSGGGGW